MLFCILLIHDITERLQARSVDFKYLLAMLKIDVI